MAIKTTYWDVAKHLDSDESIVVFLEVVLEEDDSVLLTAALGDIARAKGMTELARRRASRWRASTGR